MGARALALRALMFALSCSPALLQLPPTLAIALQGGGSGIVTPVMFAYLMEAVAGSKCTVTRYTLLQCCDDLSRFLGQAAAGTFASKLGYQATFIAAVIMSTAPLLFLSDKWQIGRCLQQK